MWRERTVSAVVLWVAFAAVEALLVGKIDPQETPVGVVIAALAAICTVGALAAAGDRYAVPLTAIASAPVLAWKIVADTGVVIVLLFRALAGRPPRELYDEIPLDERGEPAEAAARRALTVAGISASPNSVVVDVDREHAVAIVHRLA